MYPNALAMDVMLALSATGQLDTVGASTKTRGNLYLVLL